MLLMLLAFAFLVLGLALVIAIMSLETIDIFNSNLKTVKQYVGIMMLVIATVFFWPAVVLVGLVLIGDKLVKLYKAKWPSTQS